MTKQDRTTLKKFFREGALPNSENYADLIDSVINQVDDGFEKSTIDGLQLNSLGNEKRVLSLYEGLDAEHANWVAEHGIDAAEGALHWRTGLYSNKRRAETLSAKSASGSEAAEEEPFQPGLTLDPTGNVGISMDRPEWRLDVAGVARMHGRTGFVYPQEAYADVKADGGWKDITPELEGCHMIEVIAGASGGEGKGRYALLHAVAMNAYNPRGWLLNWLFRRRAIRHQQAVFGNYADRLKLRWKRSKSSRFAYRLQICTMANLGKNARIRYSLSHLWHDPRMQRSVAESKTE